MSFATHLFPTLADSWLSLPFGMQVSEGTLDMLINIALSGATLVVALLLGLFLRRLLVRQLKSTILDNWIVQTLGLLVLLVPLALGGIVALAIWNHLAALLDDLSKRGGFNPYELGIRAIETILLIVLGIGIARTLKKQILGAQKNGLVENRLDINTRTLIGRIISIITLIVAGFWMLSIWNIELGIPIAAVSVITVVITISIQDILKDLMAGFYLLITRPFYIGDQISVALGMVIYVGKVQNIELRATRLRLVTGEEVSIPNAQLFTNAVVNLTYFEERRATIEVKLPEASFSQQETALQILQTIKENELLLLKPEPLVLFQGFADEKATLYVRFWVSSKQTIDISDIMYTLHELLPDADLSIREPAANTL